MADLAILLLRTTARAFYPADGLQIENLLAEADRRMYSMKAVHRGSRSTASRSPSPLDRDPAYQEPALHSR